MPRPKKQIPTYRPHKARNCGKAVFGKTTVYFPGEFNSPQSLESYYQTVAHWLETGKLPGHYPASEILVNELLLEFWKNQVQIRYLKNGKPTTEQRSYALAMKPARMFYGMQPVSEFTPKALVVCRRWFVEQGYTRKRINQHVGRLRRIFKWGVAQEIVPETTWRALGAVEGLRRGEAKEPKKILPVQESSIEAIKTLVTPPIWAMIQIQLWTGARPGEVCMMRTCDIQATDPELPSSVGELCHVYRPQSHKTEHHERKRIILLGPQAWNVIEPWLRPAEPEKYLFSPAEARRWYFDKLRATASSPRKNHIRKPNPQRKPKDHYEVQSYGRAIARACESAGVPHWHPNQLRHNAATQLRAN